MKNFSVCLISSLLLLGGCVVKAPEPCGAVPDGRQLEWHALEEMAFVHFTVNTFTEKEWGYGDESESLFNPTDMDAGQIVGTAAAAGFKALILTAKHHDGFCLWPSEYTEHSVKNSPYRDGKGDIVGEFAAACQKYGLKFGLYLSPWDRNRADYGTDSYITYYRNQLSELLTNYGDIFEIWFDGANGGDGYYGGAREKRSIVANEYYGWKETVELIHSIQPNTIIFSSMYPDARWCGNESGFAAETNWCTGDANLFYRPEGEDTYLLHHGIEDGSEWIPCEVDVSIRPGWFYHSDQQPKSAEELFGIYLTSVGRNGSLLLNLVPDKRGRLPEQDVTELLGFKRIKDSVFNVNLAAAAAVSATSYRGPAFGAAQLSADSAGYWAARDGISSAILTLAWKEAVVPRYMVVGEEIALGQRIRLFDVQTLVGGRWVTVGSGTTVGRKRIVALDQFSTDSLRLRILDAKACPTLSTLQVF